MNIEERLQKIEERNIRVQTDKAWETSIFRIASIMIITYVIACAVLFAIRNDKPFINALIPALGYFLSTQSLPFIKKWWVSHYVRALK